MRPYSDFPGKRVLEIVGDLVAVLLVVGGLALASALHGAIAGLDAIGGKVQVSGQDLAATMTTIGQNLSGVPLIGDAIRAPFDSASAAGGTLADAGVQWQDRVHLLAALAGWTVAALVVLIVALGWVRPRVRTAVRRAALVRLAASAEPRDLLALRALMTLPTRELLRAGPDVADRWRRADAETISRLADLELRRAGVRSRLR